MAATVALKLGLDEGLNERRKRKEKGWLPWLEQVEERGSYQIKSDKTRWVSVFTSLHFGAVN